MIRVVEGRGAAKRVPVVLHFLTYPEMFNGAETQAQVRAILDAYPCDAQLIPWRNVTLYDAPADDPSYCWMPSTMPRQEMSAALDAQVPLSDWAMLDAVLADFPDPNYPGLFPNPPAPDGRYRVAHWWFTLFERHWQLRGMENALMDFYTNPDDVHHLYRALTVFYLRVIERAKFEVHADAVYATDDLGMQTAPFFSPEIFDAFFAPYYSEIFKRIHELGMHYWMHTCGNIEPLLPKLIDLGLDVLHPIQKYAMNEVDVARRYGGKITFWAGFDVQKTIPFGSPEDVRKEVRHLMDTYYRPEGRLIFTAGNMITGDTPLASLDALFDEAYRYGGLVASSGKRIPGTCA